MFSHPPQYHLYAPVGPRPENLLPYQRTVQDFFMPDALREEFQRKADAALQILPTSTLPARVDIFHSLVPLDNTPQRGHSVFGYQSCLYKAFSARDGQIYALRRIEGNS